MRVHYYELFIMSKNKYKIPERNKHHVQKIKTNQNNFRPLINNTRTWKTIKQCP